MQARSKITFARRTIQSGDGGFDSPPPAHTHQENPTPYGHNGPGDFTTPPEQAGYNDDGDRAGIQASDKQLMKTLSIYPSGQGDGDRRHEEGLGDVEQRRPEQASGGFAATGSRTGDSSRHNGYGNGKPEPQRASGFAEGSGGEVGLTMTGPESERESQVREREIQMQRWQDQRKSEACVKKAPHTELTGWEKSQEYVKGEPGAGKNVGVAGEDWLEQEMQIDENAETAQETHLVQKRGNHPRFKAEPGLLEPQAMQQPLETQEDYVMGDVVKGQEKPQRAESVDVMDHDTQMALVASSAQERHTPQQPLDNFDTCSRQPSNLDFATGQRGQQSREQPRTPGHTINNHISNCHSQSSASLQHSPEYALQQPESSQHEITHSQNTASEGVQGFGMPQKIVKFQISPRGYDTSLTPRTDSITPVRSVKLRDGGLYHSAMYTRKGRDSQGQPRVAGTSTNIELQQSHENPNTQQRNIGQLMNDTSRVHPLDSTITSNAGISQNRVETRHPIRNELHQQIFDQPNHGPAPRFSQYSLDAYGTPQMPFQHMQTGMQGRDQNAIYSHNAFDYQFDDYYGPMPMQTSGLFQPGCYPPYQHGDRMSGQQPANPYMALPHGSGKRGAVEELDIRDSDDCNESSDSDAESDAEPLMTRTKRHHSQDSVPGYSSQLSSGIAQSEEVSSEEVQFIGGQPSRSRPAKATILLQKGGESATSARGKVPSLPRPLPKRRSPDRPVDDPTTISWKIPSHSIDAAPNDRETENPVVKVTLPGCVRETLLLSMDHAEQELHLLQELFLPAHQALLEPDPHPRQAIVNFHNICVMVLDAYYAHQVGDLVPAQPLPPSRNATLADHIAYQKKCEAAKEESELNKDAREINEDDIFFATIDRWRAGLEEPVKQAYTLIRGPQEFTDIALDIIYYIKQNGMISTSPRRRKELQGVKQRVRAERSDKGMKRGPRGSGVMVKRGPGRPPSDIKNGGGLKSAAVTGKGKAAKARAGTGTRSKPNLLTGRKRAKTDTITVVPRKTSKK